jgi:hypothetical protein
MAFTGAERKPLTEQADAQAQNLARKDDWLTPSCHLPEEFAATSLVVPGVKLFGFATTQRAG